MTRVKVDLAERANADIADDEAEDDADEASQEMLIVQRWRYTAKACSCRRSINHCISAASSSRVSLEFERTVAPYEIVEFDAGFGEPSVGKAFNFNVRGWSTQRDGF